MPILSCPLNSTQPEFSNLCLFISKALFSFIPEVLSLMTRPLCLHLFICQEEMEMISYLDLHFATQFGNTKLKLQLPVAVLNLILYNGMLQFKKSCSGHMMTLSGLWKLLLLVATSLMLSF